MAAHAGLELTPDTPREQGREGTALDHPVPAGGPGGEQRKLAAEVDRLNAVIACLNRQLDDARTDKLTRLPTREDWTEQAETLLRELHEDVFVLLLDLNDFKRINDRHGHHIGNAVLRVQADRLRLWCDHLAGYGVVGRLYGDEMVAAFRLHQPSDLDRALDSLGNCLAKPCIVDGLRLTASAAIGVAPAAPGRPLDILMQAADKAMYAAKGQRGESWWQLAEDKNLADKVDHSPKNRPRDHLLRGSDGRAQE